MFFRVLLRRPVLLGLLLIDVYRVMAVSFSHDWELPEAIIHHCSCAAVLLLLLTFVEGPLAWVPRVPFLFALWQKLHSSLWLWPAALKRQLEWKTCDSILFVWFIYFCITLGKLLNQLSGIGYKGIFLNALTAWGYLSCSATPALKAEHEAGQISCYSLVHLLLCGSKLSNIDLDWVFTDRT